MTHIGDASGGPAGNQYRLPQVFTQQVVGSSTEYIWTNSQPWRVIVTHASINTTGTGLTSSLGVIYGPYDLTVILCALPNGGTGFAAQVFPLDVPVLPGAQLGFKSFSADFAFSIWGYAATET